MARSATSGTSVVTDAMREQYGTEGYFIVEQALPAEHLELLRDVSAHAVDTAHARMDAAGTDRLGLNVRGRRYFTHHLVKERPELREVLFSPLLAEVCRATIGDDAYLFWEQFVLKGADVDTTFSWHQDSGYVHEQHDPYVTVWIALDDVTEENGSVYLLPYSRSGIRSYVRHIPDERTNDKVCYFGDDPGIPVVVPAGSIAVFSSVVIHRSGPNRTDAMRRVYLAQYSREVITHRDGTTPWGEFDRFLDGGRIVASTTG